MELRAAQRGPAAEVGLPGGAETAERGAGRIQGTRRKTHYYIRNDAYEQKGNNVFIIDRLLLSLMFIFD